MEEDVATSKLVPLIQTDNSIREDAGTKYVLESKGTWLHAGYHLTSATAGPPLLALPFAMVALGWSYGIALLIVSSIVSFYANYSLSLAVEELATRGKQCVRFRDVALHSVGPLWAYCVVAPLQYFGCFIVVVALMLLGGQTLKGIFSEGLLSYQQLALYDYTILFGAFTLLLSQSPSFHSLRHFNLLSIMLCLGYSVCGIAGSIVSGFSSNAPPKDYSVEGSSVDIMFGAFSSISIMMNAYANPLVVEIQATLAPPVTGQLLKGLVLCYGVANGTFFSVMISGYWAFGKSVDGIVFNSIKSYAPLWLYILGYTLAFLQLIVHTVVYLQPLFAKYESMVVDMNKGRFSLRNLVPRIVGRSLMVGSTVFLASMLPFFADFSALMGALGFIPLCIIFPLLFHTVIFKDRSTRRWKMMRTLNVIIIVLCCFATIIGTIAAIRQIIMDVDTYSLFPSL